MDFIFDKKPTALTIYGKSCEIPTKTAYFVDEANRIINAIAKAENALEAARLTLDGIALYLGEDFVNEHFDRENIGEIDTDEIGALWIFLRNASAAATAEVLKKYAPAPISR